MMKKLLWIEDSTGNQTSYYHLVLLLLSLPYDRFFSHLILISMTVHTIIQFNKKSVKPFFTLQNLLLQSVFFLTLFGTIYTANRPEAFKEWEKQISIFLIPVLFSMNSLDLKKYRNNLLILFSLSTTFAVLYLYSKALVTIQYYQFPLSALFTSAFTNHNFARPIEMHATFFSMQIALAIVFLISTVISIRELRSKIFYSICCIILAAGIVQLSSKSVSVALLLIINFAIPYFLLLNIRKVRFILLSVFLWIVLPTGVYQMDQFRERYVDDLKKDLSEASANELTDPRLARWEVAIKLAARSPFIGYGSGSEIELLGQRFYEKKFYRSFLYKLNSHNQYISFFIKTGITGLLIYLAVLFWGFKTSLIRRDLMLFCFIAIITAVSFSENFLDVDKGIFFYSVFFSLLIFSGSNPDKKAIEEKVI
ncbi:O-antigen ligase family protein [Dyadobacter frigoris]|uniref:O-antigen ligase family protein n=1 Tax=Dyadobacter frigoris TaxID=2576211 RepID=A0A4U6D0C8_9BACT|nr:O-antigen ligase family protein [Dyadobacter frigoris]TKT90609.1 O-antigen ligase family protein [Dyadobacter frigoris]GLU51242.1 hypothetical protein Dfri01_07030 [Dyadobacter frigoris]